MAGSSGVMDGDFMKHAEYTPKSSGQKETDIDKRLSFSAYYKGGFEQKMTRREASFILGISAVPTSTKAKVLEAHRRIMVLNHPDKGGSPYLAANINEAKDLLDSGPRC
ncbi:dnaJ homolog subfamily C member 15-like [Sinocyclocheilus rhinocerous]|uniref:dnaJ homolog subfamily C member 15-like n=1 Tax=Sinocyclocheilus rhinocerous TaxID=307959 RepID=UPI0007B7A99F|nr:PREDICTED: dnaJ homolog subfamily C member 15-like [Sinocyclocheilus rhinocerous]